jgi:hypothetical protein
MAGKPKIQQEKTEQTEQRKNGGDDKGTPKAFGEGIKNAAIVAGQSAGL